MMRPWRSLSLEASSQKVQLHVASAVDTIHSNNINLLYLDYFSLKRGIS